MSYKPPIRKYINPSTDSEIRPKGFNWTGFVIHHVDVPTKPTKEKSYFESMTDWLTRPDKNYLSAHKLIGFDGRVSYLVDPAVRIAYHAGKSSYWNPQFRKWMDNCNRFMIGYELVGDGNKFNYPDAQILSLADEMSDDMILFPTIQQNCIAGHEQVSPGRKIDPGKFFPWNLLFDALNEKLREKKLIQSLRVP